MVSLNAPVILYYNGDLKNEGNIVEYLNGSSKLFQASKTISFTEFCVKVQNACGITLGGGRNKVMTRMRLDEHSVVAIEVTDDASLVTAMNMHPSTCSVVVFYVVQEVSSQLYADVPTGIAVPREVFNQGDASSISNGRDVNERFGLQVGGFKRQKRPSVVRKVIGNPLDGVNQDDTNVQLEEDTFIYRMDPKLDNVNPLYRANAELFPYDDDEKVESNASHDWDCTKEFTTSEDFNNRDDLLSWARKIGMSLGFVVIIGKSNLKNGKIPRASLQCSRHGSYRDRRRKQDQEKIDMNNGIKKRQRTSKQIGCPFQLRAAQKDKLTDIWNVEVACGRHNHPPDGPESDRLTEEEKLLVIEMSKLDDRPREILEFLKEKRPEKNYTIKTIYNFKNQWLRSLKNSDVQPRSSEENGGFFEDVTYSTSGGGAEDSSAMYS